MKSLFTLLVVLVLSITSAYSQILNGIKAHWPLNGNAQDVSGVLNHGTIVGTTTATTDRNGITSGALYLDGDDYINIDALVNDISTNTAGTISLWVKPVAANPSTTQHLICFGDTDISTFLTIQMNQYNVGRIRVWTEKSWSAYYTIDPVTNPFSNNTWTHVAITHNGTSLSIYVNGAVVTVQNVTMNNASAWFNSLQGIDNGRIGAANTANNPTANFFIGSVDEVGVWDRALTSTEINQIYTSGIPIIPAVPTALTTTAGAIGVINLTWADASNNETGFEIERSLSSGSGFTLINTTTANATTYSDTGLSASTTYYYRIRSKNTGGSSAYTSVAYATTVGSGTGPIIPSAPAATSVSSTSINLTWTDASSNETGFMIERSLTSGSGFTLVTTTSANVVSYSDTGLTPATQYFYRIRATNASGTSAYTTEVTATTAQGIPTAPTSLVALTASTTSINLTWTDASNNETGFQVERSLTAGTGFTLITTTAANAVSYSNTGLTAGSQYYYRIRAINAAGNSAYTAEATAKTSAPTVPSALVATTASTTSINLTWTDASNNETGFQVERSLTTGTGFTLITTTAANAVSYSNTGLTAGTQYYYRIRAINAAGNSAYTAEATAKTSAPTVPSALLATTASATSINLTWTDASNNETGFQVERSLTTGTGFTLITTTAANAVSYSNIGLTAGIQYYYRIRAINAAGNSVYTAEATAKTSEPVAPTGLTAATGIAGTINLSWTDASNNETGFQVERSLTTGTGFTLVTTTAANVISYSNTGLTSNTAYYYRIRAVNAAGNSPYTLEATVTTLPSAPSAPTSLVATVGSISIINLTWADASNNETGFQIERSATPGSGFALITTVAANSTSYSNTGLTAGTAYYFRIRSVNTGGNSAYTAEASATTTQLPPPETPTDLTAAAASPTSIVLNWVDASNNETGFEVERSLTQSGGFTLVSTTNANAASYSDAGLNAVTTYYYRIRSKNTTGASVYTFVVSATTPEAPPPPPSQLVSTASTSSIVLSWKDNSTNETEFLVERSLTSGTGFTQLGSAPANSISYTDPSVIAGTIYYYRIRASNNGGNSLYTGEVNTTLPIAGITQLCKGLFCDVNGGVGVGTQIIPVGYRMSVKGKVMAEGVKVDLQTAWPDYVFESTYKLPEISSLKKYIDTNKHLPNMPSALEVEKEGMDIADINVRLLEKIEELTLYMIKMEERMKEVEVENQRLKNKTAKK